MGADQMSHPGYLCKQCPQLSEDFFPVTYENVPEDLKAGKTYRRIQESGQARHGIYPAADKVVLRLLYGTLKPQVLRPDAIPDEEGGSESS